jgi:hypothetical protein
MSLPVVNATAAVLARVSAAFNAPLARAVVFGVHIDGKSLFPHGFIRRVGGLVSHIQS